MSLSSSDHFFGKVVPIFMDSLIFVHLDLVISYLKLMNYTFQIKVYNQLSKQKIPFIVEFGDDPRITPWSFKGDQIVYHLWLRPDDRWIQITILYKRGDGKYLWYGPVKSFSTLPAISKNMSTDQFGDFEGTFDT